MLYNPIKTRFKTESRAALEGRWKNELKFNYLLIFICGIIPL